VELILPSLGFGLLYLRFGLLPGIVLHYAFDATWFALPLFASTAPGAWVQQALVVVIGLAPLWIVLARRARLGRPGDIAPSLNRAWTHAAPATVEHEPASVESPVLGRRALGLVTVAGVIGLAAWLATSWRGRRGPAPPRRRAA